MNNATVKLVPQWGNNRMKKAMINTGLTPKSTPKKKKTSDNRKS